MQQNGIVFEDNYSYRQLLQKSGPEIINQIQSKQDTQPCNTCDKPLLNMSKIY